MNNGNNFLQLKTQLTIWLFSPKGIDYTTLSPIAGAGQSRGGRHSSYIVILRYYFEAITVSRKFLLSDIIMISIVSRLTEESLYALNYTN